MGLWLHPKSNKLVFDTSKLWLSILVTHFHCVVEEVLVVVCIHQILIYMGKVAV